ncbi:hypothetical protein BpHYR1_025040 [Brachionus plicatilis]|uniref:Uncharacterized protein n=1 Tax=Brachionus plicatilis TaxID=10195 RepID=A0A3M7RP50_BRAPC|nr:hypothetical protein BpHYR1_025040 [Brachionus plicatilis]
MLCHSGKKDADEDGCSRPDLAVAVEAACWLGLATRLSTLTRRNSMSFSLSYMSCWFCTITF